MAETVTLPKAGFQWKSRYWFYIGGVAVSSYVIAHFAKQYALLDKTCFKPKGFVPNKLTLDEADFNVKLVMKNKSAISYYIQNQIYNVYINNNFVSTVKNPNQIFVSPEMGTDIWLNVKFNPLKVANLSWATLKDVLVKDSQVKIQLKGNARVTTKEGLFSFNYPVDETFTLKELFAPSDPNDPC